MKAPSKRRLAILILAILIGVTTVALIVYKERQYRREVDELSRKFGEVSRDAARLADMQAQFFNIATNLPNAIADLNSTLETAVARNDADGYKELQRKSQELKNWIEHQKASSQQSKLVLYNLPGATKTNPVLFTAEVGPLLEQIDFAYRVYLHDIQQLASAVTKTGEPDPKPALLAKAQKDSKVLLGLAHQAYAHGEVINLFRAGAEDWFASVRNTLLEWPTAMKRVLLFSAILAVVVLLSLVGVLIYPLVVAPLQTKLAEKEQVIQRQEQFAHLGELAAVVAHEIKNPLTAINARLYTLQRTLAEGTDEHTDASVIRTEIRRLDQIVKNFLKLDRPAEPNLCWIKAGPLLEEVRDLFIPQLEGQSITIKVDTAADEPFLADPQQLKQVLINLIQNAAESMQHDGQITLRAHMGMARLKGRESQAVITEVEDTGPGIPPEIQRRLFHPFFTTKEGGTGLGLPISARIVDRLGGRLDFQTTLNHGTTFRIILPLQQPPA